MDGPTWTSAPRRWANNSSKLSFFSYFTFFNSAELKKMRKISKWRDATVTTLLVGNLENVLSVRPRHYFFRFFFHLFLILRSWKKGKIEKKEIRTNYCSFPLTHSSMLARPPKSISSGKKHEKSRIPNFCYIQVIVFDLSYLPVTAVGTLIFIFTIFSW